MILGHAREPDLLLIRSAVAAFKHQLDSLVHFTRLLDIETLREHGDVVGRMNQVTKAMACLECAHVKVVQRVTGVDHVD